MSSEAKKINDSDVYRVRRSTRLNEASFLCKIIMKKHGNVQIEGMGECMSLVTKISQILTKNGYANIKFIRSERVDGTNSRSISPKLIIRLEKSAGFDKMTEQIVLRS